MPQAAWRRHVSEPRRTVAVLQLITEGTPALCSPQGRCPPTLSVLLGVRRGILQAPVLSGAGAGDRTHDRGLTPELNPGPMSCPCINHGTEWGRELTPSPGTHLPPRPPPFPSSCPLPHEDVSPAPAVATSPRENQGTRLALHGMLSPARSLQPGPVAPGPSYTEHKTGVKAGELPSITAPTPASPTPRHSRPLGPGKGWLQYVGQVPAK